MTHTGSIARRLRDILARNFSSLGLKIALAVWLVILFLSVAHEYYVCMGNHEVFLDRITTPSFWVLPLLSFIILQSILSKVVILPLKRFEVYLKALEKGEEKPPFVFKGKDELGYVTEKVSNLYEIVERIMEKKEMPLSLLSDFIETTVGILDIPTLMNHFFGTLRRILNFHAGAYLIHHDGYFDARVYTTFNLDEERVEEISKTLLKKGLDHCPDLPISSIGRPEVSTMGSRIDPPGFKDPTYSTIPIVCRGRPIGVILLISYGRNAPSLELMAVKPLINHTTTVLERLLHHRFLEKKKLSQILSSMEEGIYIMDNYGYVTVLNRKGLELLGSFCRDSVDCLRKDFGLAQCPPSPDATCSIRRFINKLRKGPPDLGDRIYREEVRNEEGLTLEVYVSALLTEEKKKDGYVIVVKDVTQEREMQKRLMISSKLIALGEMAAGIAHEINNPLQVVLGNAEILERVLKDGEGRKRLERIREGAVRIKDIVYDLLLFSRKRIEDEEVEVNAVVEKGTRLVERQLNLAHIDVELDLYPAPLIVKGNAGMLQEVIINLLNNAKDAIQESGQGGRVLIKSRHGSGGEVVIEVSDDGPGIPEGIQDRIFDLFFTTKDVGKGTGLGLSLSRKIIEGMGGTIGVSSRSGKGATFRITLPLASRKEETIADKPTLSRQAGCQSSLSDKTVLIIDNEERIVELIREVLEPMVSVIDIASKGREGLERIRERDYDIILLDMKMPDMDGVQLYRDIKTSKPYLADRVVFVTGDAMSESTRAFFTLTGCRYIAKPFTIDELIDTLCKEVEERYLES